MVQLTPTDKTVIRLFRKTNTGKTDAIMRGTEALASKQLRSEYKNVSLELYGCCRKTAKKKRMLYLICYTATSFFPTASKNFRAISRMQ